MVHFTPPVPILDARELQLFDTLTKEYENFRRPGVVGNALKKANAFVSKITPEKWKQLSSDAVNAAMETAVIQQVLEVAGKGFGTLTHHAAKWLVIKPDQVLKRLTKAGHKADSYNHVCALRSYWIEKASTSKDFENKLFACIEGGITGAPGLAGVPFNIAFSFLLYFRATQSIAMHYGYDVQNDVRELEIASQITIECLSPGTLEGRECLEGLFGKMMLVGELSALRSSLSKTYGDMAAKGGLSLFYVQLRALANKAAQKALSKSGEKGLEASIFKSMLEQVAKLIPKITAQKAIPIISAVIGAGVDTYVMHRVLKGANIIYHKRFIAEKEDRISLLSSESI